MDESQIAPTKQKIVHKDLFKDRLLITMIAGGLAVAVTIVIRVLLSTNRYDIDIPIRYTQFSDTDAYITGDWFNHYYFAVFVVLALIINTLIALRIYRHRRWVSITILSAQLFIFAFVFVVAGAIINTLPVAA